MKSLLILYGSETGTAEDVAESLWKEARLLDVPARLYGVDDYTMDNLPTEHVVVFVVATTGQGEIPPNMRNGWKRLLRRSLSSTWLEKVHFAVLGLGDSSYQKYNYASKKVYRRLLQLGGECLLNIGLADDQHEIGIDGAIIPWKKEFWEKLRKDRLFENMKSDVDPNTVLPPKYNLIYEDAASTNGKSLEPDQYQEVTVVSNKRVTAEDHFQDTRLVSFKMTQSYEPGDVLMVQPRNLKESIEIALGALKYSDEVLDRPFRLEASDEFVKLPPKWLIGERTTLRSCFNCLFDLQMIPRKSFFQTLASISTHPDEKEKLLEFINPENLDHFLDYTTRCRRTTAEMLRDFPETSANIPPERLFDLFITIRPRAFSIASSPSMENLQILVAKVFVKLRSGTLKLPKEHKQVICIGPGTGVAPFRSYLTWRNRSEGAARSVLFFGCRGKKRDFYFENEWDQLPNTHVYTAFSRDTDQKVYVQHMILKHADEVWEILGEQDGMAFIAGSSLNMPKDVGAAIDKVGVQHGWAEGSFLSKLEATGRLQYETWS
ncbi:flavodoxin [Oesophagostomum dentatum]|uniref:Flavodoxin n=1 Tax=Oesophagostomum dentatum TaxID=61180 RepID=A0A0B1S2N9_OESDE|nr:flavodoxin [Oesophagostomum dentatum]